MELLKPEQCTAYEEVANLCLFIVEYICSPVGMFAAAGIGMLIYGSSVKSCKSVSVLGEVCRNPVEYYAYAVIVHIIYEILEVLG